MRNMRVTVTVELEFKDHLFVDEDLKDLRISAADAAETAADVIESSVLGTYCSEAETYASQLVESSAGSHQIEWN